MSIEGREAGHPPATQRISLICARLWTASEMTLRRVEADLGITERRDMSEDAGKPWPDFVNGDID